MKLGILLLVISLLATISAHAGDHLEPEASIYSGYSLGDYDEILLTVLGNALERPATVSMVAIPSFNNEYSVFVEATADKFKIVHERSTAHLWRYELAEMYRLGKLSTLKSDGEKNNPDSEVQKLLEGLPVDYRDVKVERCEISIEQALAEAIMNDWDEALLQTRYTEDPTYGMDGSTYHFSNGLMGGQVWSPRDNTRMDQLVQLTNDMRDYCHNQDAALLEEMTKDAKHLNLLLRLSRHR